MPKRDRPTTKRDITEAFGEPAFVVTTDDGIAAGALFDAGRFGQRRVVLSSNLLAKVMDAKVIVSAVVHGIGLAQTFKHLPDTRSFKIGNQRFFVADDGMSITVMLPEDN